MILRLIAALLLSAFVLVTGVGAVHTHSTVVGEKTAFAAHEGHSDGASCAFCKVVNERIAVVNDVEVYAAHCGVACYELVVAQMISDRSPLETPGRAPPRG